MEIVSHFNWLEWFFQEFAEVEGKGMMFYKLYIMITFMGKFLEKILASLKFYKFNTELLGIYILWYFKPQSWRYEVVDYHNYTSLYH